MGGGDLSLHSARGQSVNGGTHEGGIDLMGGGGGGGGGGRVT